MIKTIECNPNVSNFTKSFKNIGYNHYTAILDIIDNSISAKATKVWIEYTKDTNNSLTVVIADNGFIKSVALRDVPHASHWSPYAFSLLQ